MRNRNEAALEVVKHLIKMVFPITGNWIIMDFDRLNRQPGLTPRVSNTDAVGTLWHLYEHWVFHYLQCESLHVKIIFFLNIISWAFSAFITVSVRSTGNGGERGDDMQQRATSWN